MVGDLVEDLLEREVPVDEVANERPRQRADEARLQRRVGLQLRCRGLARAQETLLQLYCSGQRTPAHSSIGSVMPWPMGS